MLILLVAAALIVYLDQITKWLIVTYLPEGGAALIEGVLRFTYVENRGAAFGMLSDNRWIFISISSLAILGMILYIIVKKPKDKLLAASLVLVVGGGVGNMIDRVLLGYVIDFIDFYAFPGIWVWVFNIADASICIGVGLMILYMIISTVKEARAAKDASEAAAPDSSSPGGDKI